MEVNPTTKLCCLVNKLYARCTVCNKWFCKDCWKELSDHLIGGGPMRCPYSGDLLVWKEIVTDRGVGLSSELVPYSPRYET